MPPKKLILLGGTPGQVQAIQYLVPTGYEIISLPLDFKRPADLEPACIFLFCPDNGDRLRRLRKLKKKSPDISIIAIAPNPTQSEIIDTFRQGAADFLVFPFTAEELGGSLDKVVRSGSTEAASFRKGSVGILGWIRKAFARQAVAVSRPDTSLYNNSLQFAPTLTRTSAPDPARSERPDVSVRFFGGLEISVREKKLPQLTSRKAAALLAYLLINRNRTLNRETLMEKFWGDSSPTSARNSLNVAVSAIRNYFRKALPGREIVRYHNERYSLNPELHIAADLDQFSALWQRGRDIEQKQGLEYALGAYNKAIELYQGDFLEEFIFEEWFTAERDNLKEIYLLILERKCAYFLQQKAFPVVIHICRKMLLKDPCLENAHRMLIDCYHQLGQRDKAIRQYHKCVDILNEEFAVEPSLQTKTLFERLIKN